MTPPRSVLSGLTLSFGLMSLSVDLLPTTVSRTVQSFRTVCPRCEEAVRLTQQYVCEAHGVIALADADKAIDTPDGGLRKVTSGDVALVRGNATKSTAVDISVYPAEQVEAATFTSGTSYSLRLGKASKGSAQAYALLVEMVRNANHAYVCEITMRSVERLYRLVARHDSLMVVELARPEDVHEVQAPEAPALEEKHLAMAEAMVQGFIEDFDPATWKSQRTERFDALHAAEAMATPEPAAVAHKVDDLMALLQRTIDAQKAA